MQLRNIFTIFVLIACAHAQRQQRQSFLDNDGVLSGSAVFRRQFLDLIRTKGARRTSESDEQWPTARVYNSESEAGSPVGVLSPSLDQRWRPSHVDGKSNEPHPLPLPFAPRNFVTKDEIGGDIPEPLRLEQFPETRFEATQEGADDTPPETVRDPATRYNSTITQHPGNQLYNSDETSRAVPRNEDGAAAQKTAASESAQDQEEEEKEKEEEEVEEDKEEEEDDIVLDESDSKAIQPSDDVYQMPSDASSLLRDSFLGMNPGMMPGLFAPTEPPASFETSTLVPPSQFERLNTPTAPRQAFSISASKRDEGSSPVDSYGSEQGTGDDSSISLEQRSWRCTIPDVLVGDEELPWTCRQRFAWRYLGEHVYPSRLYEAVCEGRTCWYGHFNCTPITYTLHVLQVCLHGCHDQRVPFPLRSRWQWTDLNVTVGCQCVR